MVNGRINHDVLVVCILGQDFKHTHPHARLTPARMTQMHHPKVPEVLGQVAPRNACSITVQHRVDKPSVVSGLGSWLACTTRQQVLNVAPLIISDGISVAHAH